MSMSVVESQAYDIRSFCAAHCVSRSYAYLEIKAGRLRRFKVGRKTLISREAADRWRRAFEEQSS